jgi:hypothetical protein
MKAMSTKVLNKWKHERGQFQNPTLKYWEPDDVLDVHFGNRPEDEVIAYSKIIYPGVQMNFRADGIPCGLEILAVVKDNEPEL